MPKYLIQFAQVHEHFRIPELESIAELYGFSLGLPEERDPFRPYMVLDLEKEEHVRLLARRCILIKSVYEYYGHGTTYPQLHESNKQSRHLWEKYIQDTSFKFLVTAYNHKIPQDRQRDVIEGFAYMDFLGKIDMKEPEITLVCFEEYYDRSMLRRHKNDGDGEFRQLYFGRLLEEGTARPLIKKFDVKKRAYYGNTSMESEISLLMANQTLASPGRILYDPFMGTGSMAYPTTHFGALIFGSDIDGRQMRGKPSPTSGRPGVYRAAAQYGTDSRVLDLATFDVTLHPWRCGGWVDAIVTDPPYGVRAGAKRIGRSKPFSPEKLATFMAHRSPPSPSPSSDSSPGPHPYIPPTRPYELSHLAADLVLLARYLLKKNGRLVFFLPTVTDEYEDVDVEGLVREANDGGEKMQLVANSLQDFGSWGRRLVTIRKMTDREYPPPVFELKREKKEEGEEEHVPAHKDFREKYFQGFRKTNPNGTSEVKE